MAYSTVNKSSSFFNTHLYSGNDTTNNQQVGLTPAFVWVKSRNTGSPTQHYMVDAARGDKKYISSNATTAEQTDSNNFDLVSGGFNLNGGNGWTNVSGRTFVSWNWKGGTTSGISGGTITPSAYSIDTTAKFGVYKYTGNGSGSQTIAHGLGGTPTCVIFKQTSGTEQWRVHYMKAPNPYSQMLLLNTNATESSQNNGLSAVSSTTITFGNDGAYNANGGTYVCYIFCDVTGYCKNGSYLGDGNTFGPFIYTGFKPSFVMVKKATGSGDSWFINDDHRTAQGLDGIGGNPNSYYMRPNEQSAEGTSASLAIDLLSNGFKIRGNDTAYNNDNSTYVYTAFGQPLVAGSNIPSTAR